METRNLNQSETIDNQAIRARSPWPVRRVERVVAIPPEMTKSAAADVPVVRIPSRAVAARSRAVLSIFRADGSEVLSIYA